ncbi:hypothetical protein KXS15_24805 [Sinorhizobium meliloti]|uniref:hypothetical protein n=1 Tax=Rhizobium meliloti TaxID=382 RepID=UPI003F17530F
MRRAAIWAGVFTFFVAAYPFGVRGQAPCPEVQDTAAAILTPDVYAWRLFVELSKPADPNTKCADAGKAFGADGEVVWETWRNVRGDIFRPGAPDPGPWLNGAPVALRQERDLESIPRKQIAIAAQRVLMGGEGAAGPLFDAVVGEGNEVRLNQHSYDFVRGNKLYDRGEQAAIAATGQQSLTFPAAAKAVKAQWRRIRDVDKPRYHWTIVETASGERQAWGLTALHITTKDLPNWFWATFEHVDNKIAGEPFPGARPNVGFQTKSVDRLACPTPPHDCEAVPSGLGLEGTKWENYRLRGSQVDFVDSIGRPTILANSQIEAPFQRESSCITCHTLAAIDKNGRPLPFNLVVGAPVPGWFNDTPTGQRIYMQQDFLFSLSRAQSSSNP